MLFRSWREWAAKWLSGEDRAADAAWEAARAAARAAERAAERADAAYTALWVADATIDLELIAEWAVGESIEVPDAKEKSND